MGLSKAIRLKHGYYSIMDLVSECEIERNAFYSLLKRGRLEGPTHRYGGSTRYYYTADEVQKIKDLLHECRS